MNQNQKPNFLGLLVLGLIVFLIVKSLKNDNNPGPGPTPPNTVIQQVIDAKYNENIGLAKSIQTVKSMVTNKQIKTAKQLAEEGSKLTSEARYQANLKLDELFNNNIPSEIKEENISNVNQFLDSVMSGHEKVAEKLKGNQ